MNFKMYRNGTETINSEIMLLYSLCSNIYIDMKVKQKYSGDNNPTFIQIVIILLC